MKDRGRALAWILVAIGVTACRGAAPPLPPIPATAGSVMVKAGDPPPLRDGETLIDRVVAVVNGDAITMSELDEAIALYRRESGGQLSDAQIETLQKTVLDRIVDNRLQVQEAIKEKIEVSDDDVRAMVDDFVKRNGGDRDKIETQLKAQGLNWDVIRRDFREQILAQRVRSRRVGRRATVTEAEIDTYIAENRAKLEAGLKYHARHIAILAEPPDSATAWTKAKNEIEGLARELGAGADFATLAREHSKDASAAAGGDLGWLARGELEPLFEQPILSLAKGQVTAPIKSSVGYHLFELDDQEELTPQMLADARQQARDILLQGKAQARLGVWMTELRKRALIAIRL